MRKVLLDTVGLLATWNMRDQWHDAAATAMALLVQDGAELYATSFVLLECANAASRTPFRPEVVELRAQLITDGKLIEATSSDCDMAWDAYLRGQPGQAGVVDLVSFEVMRRLMITDVFPNDRHFREAGFNTLF